MGGAFVLDDRPFMFDNPQLTRPHGLAYFFTRDVYAYSNMVGAHSPNYRPLFIIVLWLFNMLWPANPLPLHIFSLALHVGATLLVLAALRRLLPGVSPLAAGTGACLFAVHPVHVEAVAWITPFTHVMATVFLLAAFLWHERGQRTEKPLLLVPAGAFFVLALFTNEIAVGFPFFIVAHDWIRRRRPLSVATVVPFLLLGAYVVVRARVLTDVLPLVFNDPAAWLRAPAFLIGYLRPLVLPWPQPLYLAMPAGWGASATGVAAAALLIAGTAALAVRPGEPRRGALLATAWIAAALLPPMAAAFNPTPLLALRSLYLASVGVSVLAALLVGALPALRRPVGLAAIGALLVVSLSTTVALNRDWRDDGAVYRRIVADNPEYFAGYLGLGRYMEAAGHVRDALALYERAVDLAPPAKAAEPLEHLGLLLGKSGQAAKSLAVFHRLVALDPDNSRAWVGVGNDLWVLGRLAEAAEAYRTAHAADPGNREACYNMVLLLRKLDRAAEAAPFIACATGRR